MRKMKLPSLLAAWMIAAAAYAADYDAVRIVAPVPNATVHDNLGRVTVVVEVQPALRAAQGDRVEVLLDGKLAATGTAPSFELLDLVRGTHTLEARVESADGSVLGVSPRVTFHLWQASRLFPNRRD